MDWYIIGKELAPEWIDDNVISEARAFLGEYYGPEDVLAFISNYRFPERSEIYNEIYYDCEGDDNCIYINNMEFDSGLAEYLIEKL